MTRSKRGGGRGEEQFQGIKNENKERRRYSKRKQKEERNEEKQMNEKKWKKQIKNKRKGRSLFLIMGKIENEDKGGEGKTTRKIKSTVIRR